MLRMADGTTINITNGDMTMSDNTKGNFVTNTGPIVEYSKRLVMEKAKSDPEKYKSLGNAKAGTMVLWGPKAASTAAVPGLKSGSESGGVPVVSVVEAMVTVGASPTTVAFSSSSSSSTVTATASVTLASASSVTGSGNTTASTGTVAQSSKPAVETSWDGVSTAGKLAVGGWVATVASAAVFVAMAVAV